VDRPGTNAEYICGCADRWAGAGERVGRRGGGAPATTITAGVLFDRLDVTRPFQAPPMLSDHRRRGWRRVYRDATASRATDLTVIASASRPETKQWCWTWAPHYVIDHTKPLAGEIGALGIGAPGFVFFHGHSTGYRDEIIKLLSQQGGFGFIDNPEPRCHPFNGESISVHLESCSPGR